MTIAGAIFLIAVGAVLRYATNIHIKGVDVDTIGLILMIAGVVGLILSFFWEAMWSDRARLRRRDGLAEREAEVPPREVREPPPPRY
jgi:hypothetical protein